MRALQHRIQVQVAVMRNKYDLTTLSVSALALVALYFTIAL